LIGLTTSFAAKRSQDNLQIDEMFPGVISKAQKILNGSQFGNAFAESLPELMQGITTVRRVIAYRLLSELRKNSPVRKKRAVIKRITLYGKQRQRKEQVVSAWAQFYSSTPSDGKISVVHFSSC
jgi:hypothetical protein